jgi:hypothetical protein
MSGAGGSGRGDGGGQVMRFWRRFVCRLRGHAECVRDHGRWQVDDRVASGECFWRELIDRCERCGTGVSITYEHRQVVWP